MYNIPWHQPFVDDQERELLERAITSTWISDGEFIHTFEQQLATQLACPQQQLLTVNSGTGALHLAFIAANIGPNDEVILPAFGFAAALNVCLMQGATPVLVDVCPDTWCLDANQLSAAITKRSKAIVLIENFGNTSDLQTVTAIAKQHGLWVIEDCAESFGSQYQGKASGTWGDIGCYSFQATKTITTGEGGAVYFADAALAEKARCIRSHGMDIQRKYWHQEIGYNFRMTNLHAAVGVAQLNKIETIFAAKRAIFTAYQEQLQHQSHVSLQTINDNVSPIIWTVAINSDSHLDSVAIREHLRQQGIETRPGFANYSTMPAYQHCRFANYPVANRLSQSIILLPSFVGMTPEQINTLCYSLQEAIADHV